MCLRTKALPTLFLKCMKGFFSGKYTKWIINDGYFVSREGGGFYFISVGINWLCVPYVYCLLLFGQCKYGPLNTLFFHMLKLLFFKKIFQESTMGNLRVKLLRGV